MGFGMPGSALYVEFCDVYKYLWFSASAWMSHRYFAGSSGCEGPVIAYDAYAAGSCLYMSNKQSMMVVNCTTTGTKASTGTCVDQHVQMVMRMKMLYHCT